MENNIDVILSKEQVDTILDALFAGEHEGLITKEEAIDLYWALGRGDECPYSS